MKTFRKGFCFHLDLAMATEYMIFSWLVASASSPMVVILTVWTIFVFKTYRNQWQTIDFLLFVIVIQDSLTTIFVFGYSLLNMVHPNMQQPCIFILWGLITTRMFQMFTLASLVVDRAIVVRWSSKCSYIIIQRHIRYHIIALAAISVFVGIATMLAWKNLKVSKVFKSSPLTFTENLDGKMCFANPLDVNHGFWIFVLAMYVTLMATILISCLDVQINQWRFSRQLFSMDALPSGSCTSTCHSLDSETQTNRTTARNDTINRSNSISASRLFELGLIPCLDSSNCDLRWKTVTTIALFLCLVVHVPFLILNILVISNPAQHWSPWYEHIIMWLRLLASSLVPLLLYLTDATHRKAHKRIFQRRRGKFSDFGAGDRNRNRVFKEGTSPSLKPRLFGPVTPVGIIMNYRTSPPKRDFRNSANYFLRTSFQHDLSSTANTIANEADMNRISLDNIFPTESKPVFSQKVEADELKDQTTKRIDMFLPECERSIRLDDKNRSTFSDNLSTFSFENQSSSFETDSADDETYGGSFTTSANEDFEYLHESQCHELEIGNAFKPTVASSSKITCNCDMNNQCNAIIDCQISVSDNIETNALHENYKTSLDKYCSPKFFPFAEHVPIRKHSRKCMCLPFNNRPEITHRNALVFPQSYLFSENKTNVNKL
ncbi:uncharacterized protein LOC143252310 [Tachypleus tridentatus]|uniref:uncharacterized protein LOC143252310 n=1 Tax=Tachypleus tridentatus TaxID=6853 RepID=UPI003FD20D49